MRVGVFVHDGRPSGPWRGNQAPRLPSPGQESRDGRDADVVEFGDFFACVALVKGEDNAPPYFHRNGFPHSPSSMREDERQYMETTTVNQLISETL